MHSARRRESAVMGLGATLPTTKNTESKKSQKLLDRIRNVVRGDGAQQVSFAKPLIVNESPQPTRYLSRTLKRDDEKEEYRVPPPNTISINGAPSTSPQMVNIEPYIKCLDQCITEMMTQRCTQTTGIFRLEPKLRSYTNLKEYLAEGQCPQVGSNETPIKISYAIKHCLSKLQLLEGFDLSSIASKKPAEIKALIESFFEGKEPYKKQLLERVMKLAHTCISSQEGKENALTAKSLGILLGPRLFPESYIADPELPNYFTALYQAYLTPETTAPEWF